MIFISLLQSLIVAVVTAWVAVWLALKRFRSEKWWEKRSEAYTAIMEAVHHIREHVENQRAADSRGATMSKELAEKLASNVEKATAEIRLRRDVGSFVISKEAVAALDMLLSDLNAALEKGLRGDTAGYFAERIAATDRALGALREIAHRHLDLP